MTKLYILKNDMQSRNFILTVEKGENIRFNRRREVNTNEKFEFLIETSESPADIKTHDTQPLF